MCIYDIRTNKLTGMRFKCSNVSLPPTPAGRLPAPILADMRQRVMIAMALSCKPALLIADEPTTALDDPSGPNSRLMKELPKQAEGTAII